MTATPIQFVRAKPDSQIGRRLLEDVARRATAENAPFVNPPRLITRSFNPPKKEPSNLSRGRPGTKVVAIDGDGKRFPFDSYEAALKAIGRTYGCVKVLIKAIDKKKIYRGYFWEKV